MEFKPSNKRHYTTKSQQKYKKKYQPRKYPLLTRKKTAKNLYMTNQERQVWGDKWEVVGKSRKNYKNKNKKNDPENATTSASTTDSDATDDELGFELNWNQIPMQIQGEEEWPTLEISESLDKNIQMEREKPVEMFPSMEQINNMSKECHISNFNYSFTLSTNSSVSHKEYVSVDKVFYYVTLGGMVSNEDMEDVKVWVQRAVDSFIRNKKIEPAEVETVYIRVPRPFDGRDDVYRVPRYLPIHYPAIAKGCINWAAANSEKIIYLKV